MYAEYPAPLTRPLKINVEYERLSHPIQAEYAKRRRIKRNFAHQHRMFKEAVI